MNYCDTQLRLGENENMIKTLVVTLVYSIVWMILEEIIYGNVKPRIVDDIMMILFMPIIYLAVNNNFYK